MPGLITKPGCRRPSLGPRSLGRGNRAFTLIELLVVVAIIAILAAMLMPALSKSRQKAMELQELNNKKSIALAANLYASDFDSWFPEVISYWYGDPDKINLDAYKMLVDSYGITYEMLNCSSGYTYYFDTWTAGVPWPALGTGGSVIWFGGNNNRYWRIGAGYRNRPDAGCYFPYAIARKTRRLNDKLDDQVVMVTDNLYFGPGCNGASFPAYLGNRHPSGAGYLSGGWGGDTVYSVAEAQSKIRMSVEVFGDLHGGFSGGDKMFPTGGNSHDRLTSLAPP